MPSRSNKHIKKFNQLVEVYDPDGVDQIEAMTSRETEYLERRQSEFAECRSRVEGLEAADFFDDDREAEIDETESLPDPETVAQSQREEMLDRLDLIEEATDDAIDGGDVLDTSDDFEL
jgi:hypothetical protein